MSVSVNIIPSLVRLHRQLRLLDEAYMDAESKKQVQSAVEAKLDELHAVHNLLPTDLRDKSWIFLMQGYNTWGKLAKS